MYFLNNEAVVGVADLPDFITATNSKSNPKTKSCYEYLYLNIYDNIK